MPQSALRQFTPQSAEPAVRSYNPFNPAFRETMRSGITDLLGGRAMGGTPSQRYRAGMADMLTGAVDFVPGVGEAVGVADTVQAARGGNYGTAAILGGATALGMVPVVGDAASGAIKKAANLINVQGKDIPVRRPSDNINNVMNSNFEYPKVIGNQTLNINDVYGGVRFDNNETQRVKELSGRITGENGYISRIIVDQDNNVVEGQHRLEALRQLGASEIPVYKIEDLSITLPVRAMENAINGAGVIHSDNVNQIMQYALENISEYGVEGARDFDFGKFQKYYDAALDVAATSPL